MGLDTGLIKAHETRLYTCDYKNNKEIKKVWLPGGSKLDDKDYESGIAFFDKDGKEINTDDDALHQFNQFVNADGTGLIGFEEGESIYFYSSY